MRFTSFGTFVICAALALVAPSQAVPVAQVNSLDAAVRPVSFIPTNSNGSAVLPASAAAPSASPVANPVSFIPVGGSGSPILPRAASPEAAELQRRELETLLTRMLNEKRVTENDLINLMLVARSGDTKH